MYGDFSRLTFAPDKHFSAVLSQQGRVTLDSDVNEQALLVQHFLRTLAADVIGPHGGPEKSFAIKLEMAGNTIKNLTIAPGRYYVHGIPCENDAVDVTGKPVPATYLYQPDLLPDPPGELLASPFLVYLRVHERLVTSVEDPSTREIALGDTGPDTAARSRIVWQVLVTDKTPGTDYKLDANLTRDAIHKAWLDWETSLSGGTGRLRAQAMSVTDTDPCISAPDARYRGLDNQLYRVEVHTGDTAGTAAQPGTATFKWSRENGSVVFPIVTFGTADADVGVEVTVASLGRDDTLGLDVGDWVEVVDDDSVRRGKPEPLRRVAAIDPLDLVVTLEPLGSGAQSTATGQNPLLHPLLRRWDQQEGSPARGGAVRSEADNALRIVETINGKDNWLDLEDGIQIQFGAGGRYERGDYWLIPARTAIGDVEWPRDTDGHPIPKPPVGITYYAAPLALVRFDADKMPEAVDLRRTITPLAK
ncbi:DUF6519 domain-containing protein [Frankia sp. Cas3]|uniref:DUF6519 domain-containing protein n=1 Tax=Frankia sp. Cas3 TaxID=3073926 RepID=UPI002AD45FF5|nr:DUF6519 domain-containing protein [Frankia sp. Cas3]